MSDVPLSSITGGGGILKISSAGLGGTIPSGTSSDFTISCPTGKFINLTFLTKDGAGTQGGISLTVGGRSIFSGKNLTASAIISNISSTLKIGQIGSSTDSQSNKQFLGGRNEDFVFSFAAATTSDIYYGYEVLEDA